jgi:hypothetical protein
LQASTGRFAFSCAAFPALFGGRFPFAVSTVRVLFLSPRFGKSVKFCQAFGNRKIYENNFVSSSLTARNKKSRSTSDVSFSPNRLTTA